MKLAITVWNERIAPVFDSAGKAVILEVCRGSMTGRREIELGKADPAGKVRLLREEGVRELICGAVSHDVDILLRSGGIRVLPFVAGDVEEVIQAWMGRQLDNDRYSMPGCFCGGRRRRWQGGR